MNGWYNVFNKLEYDLNDVSAATNNGQHKTNQIPLAGKSFSYSGHCPVKKWSAAIACGGKYIVN